MGFKVRTVWAFEESFLLKIQIEESNQVSQQNALFYWNNIGISIKQSITKFGSLNEDWYIRVSHDVRTAVVYEYILDVFSIVPTIHTSYKDVYICTNFSCLLHVC